MSPGFSRRFPALKRRPILGKFLGILVVSLAFLISGALTVAADTTTNLSDAEIQGRVLAQKILEQRPAAFQTNTGILQIRDDDGHRHELRVECTTFAAPSTPAYWGQTYEADSTNRYAVLIVLHAQSGANNYSYTTNQVKQIPVAGELPQVENLFNHRQTSGAELMSPFAGSDFWLCDLGLEFFHWPQQKVLKKEFHRQCACTVLESTNPNPTANGYSRVVSWIDNDSLGIVEANAYDVNGKQLKNFEPKNFQKVNGQYQVESMIMENIQTGSRSTLKFDLNK